MGPLPPLAINAGRQPFLLAAVLATAAAFLLCGAEHGTGELIHWEVFVVGVVVTGIAILVPLRAAAGLIALFGVPILAGLLGYVLELDHAARTLREIHSSARAFDEVALRPYLADRANWVAALGYASLAALAGWRRVEGTDAFDRNGLLAGVWMLAAGTVIALVALERPEWLRSNEIFTDHITGSEGGFGGLRGVTLGLAAACALAGGVLAAMSALRRRRRRAFLDGVVAGRVSGWSIERGDDPSLPMFLDPAPRRATGVLVRGRAGAGGPRMARVRV